MSAEQIWDAIIIGAGPAGSLAAYLLARQNYSVLLLDKATFPRHKVCGCCLNAHSICLLRKHGLGKIIAELTPAPLHAFCLKTKENYLELALPESLALSREAFDMALIQSASQAGAEFRPNTAASVMDSLQADMVLVKVRNSTKRQATCESNELSYFHREMLEQSGTVEQKGTAEHETILAGRIVIVADGLAGRALENLAEFSPKIRRSSRIGAGTIIAPALPFYRPGQIYMACGEGGYVGLVRIEDERLDLACALDLDFARQSGGPAKACTLLLEQVGYPLPAPDMQASQWQGTSTLSRFRKKKAGRRIFLIGDAASYAEPLTGEGISWALLSASALVPIAQAAILNWSDRFINAWTCEYSRIIGKRQFVSASLARLLRSTQLTNLSLEAIKRMPFIAESLLLYLNSQANSAPAYQPGLSSGVLFTSSPSSFSADYSGLSDQSGLSEVSQ